ncbi:hypothetical protein [Acidiphilium rubrum]|nr:hypothetical protein [Acidiphilium rubrum]
MPFPKPASGMVNIMIAINGIRRVLPGCLAARPPLMRHRQWI